MCPNGESCNVLYLESRGTQLHRNLPVWYQGRRRRSPLPSEALDPRDLVEWLLVDMGLMLETQSLLEVSADEELVRTAGNLIQAVNVVLEMTTDGLAKSVSQARPIMRS